MSIGISGTIFCNGNGYYEWIIEKDCFPLRDRAIKGRSEILRSPDINFCGQTLKLELFFGDVWIELVFKKTKWAVSEPLSLSGGVRELGSITHQFQGELNKPEPGTVQKWLSYFFVYDMHLKRSKSLTICCEMRKLRKDSSLASQNLLPIHKRMQEDFKNLLSSGQESDVVIKANGWVFPVHRAILRARSPVFNAMFTHETAEKQSGVVNMEDCDPQTLADFLYYIYTGRCDHITITNVTHLYSGADKYDLPELKEESLKFMKSKLTVEAFVHFVSLALQHSERELMDAAINYFRQNKKEILKTPGWEIFLRTNTKEANALLINALS